MKPLSLLILSPIVALFFSSCGTNGCEQARESYCLAEMKQVGEAKLGQLHAFGIGQGKAENKDTGIFDDQEMISTSNPKTLEFILRPDTTVTDIRLRMSVSLDAEQAQVEDTLHFVYDPHPYFLDMECGCSMYFLLQEVTSTGHFLKNITILNKEITNAQTFNLLIEY